MRCTATKRDGARCALRATNGDVCGTHDPGQVRPSNWTAGLDPCPFCGRKPHRRRGKRYRWVECHYAKCSAIVSACGKTQEEADAKWNTRG